MNPRSSSSSTCRYEKEGARKKSCDLIYKRSLLISWECVTHIFTYLSTVEQNKTEIHNNSKMVGWNQSNFFLDLNSKIRVGRDANHFIVYDVLLESLLLF